jgi:hypothetical protein
MNNPFPPLPWILVDVGIVKYALRFLRIHAQSEKSLLWPLRNAGRLVLPFNSCRGILPGIALQTGTKAVPCSRVRPARLLSVHPPANAVDQNARAISKIQIRANL